MTAGSIEVAGLAGAAERYRALWSRLARWRWAAVAVAAAVSGCYHPVLLPDPIRFARAGLLILQGRPAEVYARPWEQGGPFELLASLLSLPLPAMRRSDFTLVSDGPALLPLHVAGAALLFALLLLTARGLRRATGLPASAEAELLVVVLALVTLLPRTMWIGGHPSQLAIPLCWAWGGALAYRGRTGAAAVVIGLSAGWETWGLLGVPVLLLDRDPKRLLRNVALAAGAAALPYLPFVLTGSFRMFELSWTVPDFSLVHQVLPGLVRFTWPMRLLQSSGAVAAGAIVVLALGRRRDVVWLTPLAVTGVRLLLDPLQLDYYWLPFLVLALLGPGLLDGRPPGAGPVRAATLLALAVLPRLVALPEPGPVARPVWPFAVCLALVCGAVAAARGRGPG